MKRAKNIREIFQLHLANGTDWEDAGDGWQCVDTTTGKAGLYDAAARKFRGNAGSEEFLRPLVGGEWWLRMSRPCSY